MKTVSANPDLFEIAHNWAATNPMEFFVGMVVTWGSICFYNAVKHSF